MTTTSAMPGEMLARIFYKNDATGAPITVAAAGSTDGNTFLFTGNGDMGSETGPTFDTVAAIASNAFTREARNDVSGATAVMRDTPITGAMSFLADILTGYKPQYDASGDISGLGIESAAAADCTRWVTAASAATSWTILELVGYRYCDDVQESVRANIFRNVQDVAPASNFQFGLEDPGTGSVDLNMVCKAAGAGWGDGPNDEFLIYDDLLAATLTTDPITLGWPVGTDALFEDLITLCACDNAIRGVPLTAALVAATPELALNGFIWTP
jgi:hypothetical protein